MPGGGQRAGARDGVTRVQAAAGVACRPQCLAVGLVAAGVEVLQYRSPASTRMGTYTEAGQQEPSSKVARYVVCVAVRR